MRVKLDAGAFPPQQAHETDAGYDLRMPLGEPITISPGCSAIIDTGVHIEIPHGYCGILVSKSGLNVKHNLQSTGLIDEPYRGSIVVKLDNNSTEYYTVNPGDKVSQIVIVPCLHDVIEIVDELPQTDRGNNGFGSTGR